MRTQRRFCIALALAALALPLAFADIALAKGERGTVTIAGPGLAAPLELNRGDAAQYGFESGLWERKWATPNLLAPDEGADLGPAYDVSLSFGPECPGDLVVQTLYPYAPGGPQTFTSGGQRMCGGAVPEGYWPAPASMLSTLVENGLPETAPVSPAGAGEQASTSGSNAGVMAAIAIAAVALAAGGAAFVRGTRRRAALG